MANSLLRAVAPIAIGVCLLSTLSLAAPPRYTWQRVGYVDNADFSIPIAIGEDGSGISFSQYFHPSETITRFDATGAIDWRLETNWHGVPFSAQIASPSGVVAGFSAESAGYPGILRWRPAIYTHENGVELLPQIEGVTHGYTRAIDSSGRYVTGEVHYESGNGAFVIWDRLAGTMTNTGDYEMRGVNRQGDSVGWKWEDAPGGGGYQLPAMRNRDGTYRLLELPAGSTRFGNAGLIDDDGRILFTTITTDNRIAFYIQEGDRTRPVTSVPTELGYGVLVNAFNAAGLSVGARYTPSECFATLWQDGNEYRLVDLVDNWDPVFDLVQAMAINQRGQILVSGGVVGDLPGYGTVDNTPGYFSFLLTPIPEPTSAAVLSLFLTGTATQRRLYAHRFRVFC